MAVAATVDRYLDRHRIEYELVAHRPTATGRESARVAHVDADHLAKGVIVKNGGRFVQAIISARQWLRLHRLEQVLGRSLAMADEQEVAGLFADCAPGAVPALGPAYGLETVLDRALTSLAHVYFEAGDHAHLIKVPGPDYLRLLAPARRGHIGHNGPE